MIIIEVYDNNYKLKKTLENIFNLEIKKQINNIWTASFSFLNKEKINKDDILLSWKISIKKYEKNRSISLFEWFIDEINQDLNKTDIFCRDNLAVLENIVFKSSIWYTSKWILNFIKWESVKALEKNWIIVFTEWNDISIPIKSWVWEVLLYVFKRLIQWKYDITSLWKDIIISDNLWEDKTKSDKKIEFYYIEEKWNKENNIIDFNINNSLKWIVNRVVSHNWKYSNIHINQASINKYWHFDKPYRIPKNSTGNPWWFINWEEWDDIKITTYMDYFEKLNIWDKIKVYIKIWNWFINLDSEARVVQKKLNLNSKISTFTLTRTNSNSINSNKIEEIEKELKFISSEYS